MVKIGPGDTNGCKLSFIEIYIELKRSLAFFSFFQLRNLILVLSSEEHTPHGRGFTKVGNPPGI